MYNTKKPVGNGVEAPTHASYEASKEMNVSLDHDGGINASASTENRSAKFKNPNVKQDVPAEGKGQYED